ncbi:MAG: hypothetical protein AAGU73_11135 [Actinomycetota bacterium]|jgi:hypothetical protein
MFDDPQVLLGAAIGIGIVIIGTALGVLGHLKRERAAAVRAGDSDG